MVLPEANEEDVPHVNEIEANAFPLPVRCPFSVAVVGCTFVAAVVVEPGVPHGVPATAALSTPVFVEVKARITTEYSIPLTRPEIAIGLVVALGDTSMNVLPPSVEYS
jgi:hypothetical protein